MSRVGVSRGTAGVRRPATALLLAPLRFYQRYVSSQLPPRCKYHPSCSAYAIEAIRELGPLRGVLVAAWRLARCNPWSDGGYDPLSARRIFRPATPAGDRDDRRRPGPASA